MALEVSVCGFGFRDWHGLKITGLMLREESAGLRVSSSPVRILAFIFDGLPVHVQAKSAAIGLPPSVMGTGRAPSNSSWDGLMPRAAWMVAWKSGTETACSMTFLLRSSVTP